MTGYLIYHPREAVRNQGFIRMFQEKGATCGIEFSYVSADSYQELEEHPLPDLVLNRTRQTQVSLWYQQRGTTVFHSASLVELANDKYKTLQYLEEHLPQQVRREKWCPASRLIEREELGEVLEGKNDLPSYSVIKSLDGHGGTEVFLTEQMESLSVLRGRNCLLQERIPSDSQDVRVYILGGEIYQAVLRTGQGDFRSNFSLGGQAMPYPLNREQEELVQCFIQAIPGGRLGLLGIDFIVSREGQLIFNEIEEMTGCRMLYQCTSRDIVGDYVAWLRKYVD